MLNLLRESRKTLCIKIDETGQMHIRAPKSMPLNDILAFVNKHENWIAKKQSNITKQRQTNEPVLSYSKFLYLGNGYDAICVNYLKELKIEGKNFLIPEKYGQKKKEYIKKWLKEQAMALVESRVLYFSKIFSISFGALFMVNSKAKWGQCNTKREISINWKAIMLPPSTIDYIILHELAHIYELNHSKEFWSVVAKMMPDYKKEKNLLKNCNYILQLF